MCLDKDILFQHNREYGPSTCAIVPVYVNNAILLKEASRSKLPVGVAYEEKNGKYYAHYTKQKKKQYVDTPEEAFAIYKKLKEDNLVYFAEKLAGYMPETVCNALRKWEVNITD